jgi:uncharacterized Zn-finger protein
MSSTDDNPNLNYQLYFPLTKSERETDLIFPCPYCNSKLQLKPTDNVSPTKDISCPTCSKVFVLAGCGRCKAPFGITPTGYEALRRTRSTMCPFCGTELICFLWPNNAPSLFKIDGKDGFELVLPQRAKNQRFVISNGSALVLECFSCKAELYKAGVLHDPAYCEQCGTCNYLIACPNCAQLSTVNCEMKDDLSSTINCSHCKVFLIWPASYVKLIGTSTRTLTEWSKDIREANYISSLNVILSGNVKQHAAVSHATTGVRIIGAEFHLMALRDLELRMFKIAVNDPEMSDLAVTGAVQSSHSRETLLDVYTFGFINSLRSSLDILVQELIIRFCPTTSEKDVDFSLKYIRGRLPPRIEQEILAFHKSSHYNYLNRLRNAMQHRRVWLDHTESVYNVHPITGGEEAIDTKIFLPNNPNALPGAQSYSENKELLASFNDLLRGVKEFIYNIYEIAAQTP